MSGDDFAAWYAAERDGMVRSLLIIGGDAEAARDAVAEAFGRAFERWDRVAAMGSPTGWVYRVALNDLRRRKLRRALESRLLRAVKPSGRGPATPRPGRW